MTKVRVGLHTDFKVNFSNSVAEGSGTSNYALVNAFIHVVKDANQW